MYKIPRNKFDGTFDIIELELDLGNTPVGILVELWAAFGEEAVKRMNANTIAFWFNSCSGARTSTSQIDFKDLLTTRTEIEFHLTSSGAFLNISEIAAFGKNIFDPSHYPPLPFTNFALVTHGGYPSATPTSSGVVAGFGHGSPMSIPLPQGITISAAFWDPVYPKQTTESPCAHEYVNVGFMHMKMICKHCDKDQDQ